MNLSGTKQTTVLCSLCNTEYGLIYQDSSDAQKVAGYIRNVQMGMQNCQAHPPYIVLNF